MNTITLREAINKAAKLKAVSAYHSVVHDKVFEDETNIANKIELLEKISAAEKASGILELRDRLSHLAIWFTYFNTSNSNLYYKENISKTDREYISNQFKYYKEEIEYITNKIDSLLDQVFIET